MHMHMHMQRVFPQDSDPRARKLDRLAARALVGWLNESCMPMLSVACRWSVGGASPNPPHERHCQRTPAPAAHSWCCLILILILIALTCHVRAGDIQYADYYERALVNGILGVSRLPSEHAPADEYHSPAAAAVSISLEAAAGAAGGAADAAIAAEQEQGDGDVELGGRRGPSDYTADYGE